MEQTSEKLFKEIELIELLRFIFKHPDRPDKINLSFKRIVELINELKN